MSRRIAAAFLAVLFAFVAIVVVPLGLIDSGRIRGDFRSGALTTARALASVSEERLDDGHADAAFRSGLTRSLQPGDGVLVLDDHHRVLARAGSAVAAGDDRLVVRAPIGTTSPPLGTVVFTRDTQPVEDRLRDLWLALAGAAVLVMLAGTLVAVRLGTWIATPLRSLVAAAGGVGAGDVTARADAATGPEQVRDVSRAFNEMADRVTSLLETQAMMTADVSHQLRTPLSALRLRLDLLADEVPADLQDEVAGMISETTRLSRLVDGLLAVARAEATLPAPRAVDVAATCADRVRSWEPLAAERGVTLALRSAGPTFAQSTPGHLEQVLDNALANAMDALAAGGVVAIDVADTPSGAIIRIADDGPGMAEQLRAHAFDRYVTDRGRDRNSGLGLAIVGRLVAADHGHAELLDTPGGGVTLVIRLPAARVRDD
jgi:signal transduction histidine kinase